MRREYAIKRMTRCEKENLMKASGGRRMQADVEV